MSELPNVEILSERLIAFFDILGFSDRLRVMPMGELHALYSELIDNVRDTIFEPIATTGELAERRTNFDRADFMFDSIILVSRDLSDPKVRGPAVHNFVSSCSTLMEKSFARQLPLRGCVGLGDYLEDKSRNIFLSRLFADLVSAEKNQEWSGCRHRQPRVPLSPASPGTRDPPDDLETVLRLADRRVMARGDGARARRRSGVVLLSGEGGKSGQA